jgi:hypothetical protein
LKTFCKNAAPGLVEAKTLSADVLANIKKIVLRDELAQALAKITSDSITDRLLQQWKEGSAVADKPVSLLSESLLTKVLLAVEYQARLEDFATKINYLNDHIKKVRSLCHLDNLLRFLPIKTVYERTSNLLKKLQFKATH